jgi:hypothetical protein
MSAPADIARTVTTIIAMDVIGAKATFVRLIGPEAIDAASITSVALHAQSLKRGARYATTLDTMKFRRIRLGRSRATGHEPRVRSS